MTTTVERTYVVEAAPEAVWELIADPSHRAAALSIVERFETDGEETIWYLRLPVRFIPGTIAVRTRDVERDPPRYVRFRGESRVMTVEGEHEITAVPAGSEIRNRFVVEGKLPGVERFFERNIDGEIDRMIAHVTDHLNVERRE